MKKVYLLVIILFVFILKSNTNVLAQCTPNVTSTVPGLYPDSFPDATVNQPYNVDITFVFFKDTSTSLLVLLILLVILIIFSFMFLISLTKLNLPLREYLPFIRRNIKRILVPFLLLVSLSLIYLFLITLIFIFSYVNVSIVLPAVLLIGIIIVINAVRSWFVTRILA